MSRSGISSSEPESDQQTVNLYRLSWGNINKMPFTTDSRTLWHFFLEFENAAKVERKVWIIVDLAIFFFFLTGVWKLEVLDWGELLDQQTSWKSPNRHQNVQGGSLVLPNPQHTNSLEIKSTFWIWEHRKSLFNSSQMFGGGGKTCSNLRVVQVSPQHLN